jgi:dihydrofolate reductase
MGKLVISTNTSLDGVVQDPDGQEGFRLGGWFGRSGRADLAEWAQVETEEAMRAEALLLGRRSDEWFARRWATREGAWADRLNGMPRYVVSSTIREPAWSGATILSGDVLAAVVKLKQELAGEILVYASYQLGRMLLEHDLADELRLTIFPVVLGDGQRLFGPTSQERPMRLASARTLGAGLAFLTYQRAVPG